MSKLCMKRRLNTNMKKASADSVFYAEEQKIADARLAVKDAELLYNKHISNGIFIVLFIIVFFQFFCY